MPNRIIYVAMTGHRFVILHAFKKDRQKTPIRHLETAEKRYAELLEREKNR